MKDLSSKKSFLLLYFLEEYVKKKDIKMVKFMYGDVSKNGIFYYVYNEDAFVVSYIMGCNVKNNKVYFLKWK